MEKDSMREMFVIKIKHMLEEKQKKLNAQAAADATSTIEDPEKSFEDADLNKTGEMSKLSNKDSV